MQESADGTAEPNAPIASITVVNADVVVDEAENDDGAVMDDRDVEADDDVHHDETGDDESHSVKEAVPV